MTTQRPTFTQRGGDGAGFFYLLASGGVAPPSLNFDFTSGVLPGAITFTRASIGTYNSSGNILTTASSNAARFNYVAGVANLLIEGSATNLNPESSNFAAWGVVSGATVAASQFVSPDGTNNGWSLTSVGAGGFIQKGGITYANIPYVMSVWAKRITGTSNMAFFMAGVSVAVTTSATLTRLFATATTPAATDTAILQMVNASSTNGIYGAQVEAGSVMTSYIPTSGTAVTRAADSAVFTIPSGIGHLTYTFDDNTTQSVTVSAGSYTIPVTLNRPNIKSIVGSA